MKTIIIPGMAAGVLLAAAMSFGPMPVLFSVKPAFAAEGGHTGGTAGHSDSGTSHSTGSHSSGESHESTSHDGESCEGGGCSGESHEDGGDSHSGGQKGSSGRGYRGGAGDFARGGGSGGIVGRIFEQDEGSKDEAKGPQAGTVTAGSSEQR